MIGLELKPGVSLSGLTPHMVLVVQCALPIWSQNGATSLTITSANDSYHSSRSLHYCGMALDFRTRNLPGGVTGHAAQACAQQLAAALGRDFDVLLEADHIHVEHQPRRPLVFETKPGGITV